MKVWEYESMGVWEYGSGLAVWRSWNCRKCKKVEIEKGNDNVRI